MTLPFITSHSFDSGKPGPALLVLGALHGNGVAGTVALNELIAALERRQLILQKGKLTLIPVANPAAYARRKRLIDVNLNRVFTPNPAPRNDEERAAQEIMPYIDACDVLLDIHS